MKINKRILLTPIIYMLLGFLLLVSIEFIPYKWIEKNVISSADILSTQGLYPVDFVDGWYMDNYTDADCISITINKESDNPFYNAINGHQVNRKDADGANGIDALLSAINGDTGKIGDHSYLWNGFQIFLRPLLIKYNIKNIRTFFQIITLLMLTYICIQYVYIEKCHWAYIPFLIPFLYFQFQMEVLSVLFFVDISITLFATIVLMHRHIANKEKNLEELFTIIGCSVAFFSMIIMPLLTLGIPLLVALTFNRAYLERPKEAFFKAIKLSASWMFGYAVTLGCKVILSKCVVNSTDGINRITYYTGESTHTILKRILQIFVVLRRVISFSETGRDIIFISIIVTFAFILKKRNYNIKILRNAWAILIVALYPIIWCFVCAEHSNHPWTPWLFSISIFAVMRIIYDICLYDHENSTITDNHLQA